MTAPTAVPRADPEAELRVALVTGGSSAIGEALSVRLAAAGFAVAIGFASDAGRVRSRDLATKIQGSGGRGMTIELDVTDVASIDAGLANVSLAWAPPIVLVNNAGTVGSSKLSHRDVDEWDLVFGVNTRGAFLTSAACIPGMSRYGWGRIVNISSPAADRVYFGGAAYGASKAALNHLTRSLGAELSRSGITVNAIAPGRVDSDMMDRLPGEVIARIASIEATDRSITPGEVADLVAYLCSNHAAMVNGQIIAVDGGGMLLPPRRVRV